jgi:hypothetical protein
MRDPTDPRFVTMLVTVERQTLLRKSLSVEQSSDVVAFSPLGRASVHGDPRAAPLKRA